MSIQLTVKNFNGDSYTIPELKPSTTLKDIIEKISQKYSVSKDSITLVHNGMPISKDNDPQTLSQTLASLNISNKQTIFVVFRVQGGK